METENEDGIEIEETLDIPETEEEDTTDWKAEAQTLRDKAIAQRERTRLLKQELADTKRAIGIANKTKTNDLDETQLDYLDLKGISEEDDIKILSRHVQRTGETIRQALKDEYVISKLAANTQAREVKGATPMATKRGGNQVNDIASAVARFDQTGELPSDFKLRSEVVNAISDKGHAKKPSWG